MDIQFWSKPIYYIVYLQAMLYQKSERQDPGHETREPKILKLNLVSP